MSYLIGSVGLHGGTHVRRHRQSGRCVGAHDRSARGEQAHRGGRDPSRQASRHHERVLAAGRVRAATRAADANQWRRAGERSAASWLARLTGTTPGQAAAELDADQKLALLPATEAARRSGQISDSQTRQITAAATADPMAETELLRRAGTDDAAAFKRRCDQVRAASELDETAARERIRRGRRYRSWTDPDGAYCFAGRGLPEDGAALHAAMRPHREKAFDDARRRDRHEHPDAYAYDGLIALAQHQRVATHARGAAAAEDTTGAACTATVAAGQLRHGPRAKLIVRIDHTALNRGHTIPGEVCEIVGTGPITVATARELARDAFLTAAVTDGVDIKTVVHLGRAATAHQRTALEARGVRCAVPGCGHSQDLQIDHVDGWATTRRTHIDQLDWLCTFHHGQKTHESYRLQGPPGERTWHPPDDTS